MKSSRPPVVRGEWNLEPSGMEMIQVKELLEAIEALKKEGVTGASVMFSFYKRRVQPIQQRCCLGFEYTGPADPSCMCTEEVPDEVALQRVQRVLLDVNTVPYVPTLYSVRNPPPPVSIRLPSLKKSATCAGTELKKFLQGHSELYCSYPPQPDLPRAYHLLPSAVQEARLAAAQGSSESAERVDSQAGGEAEGEPRPAAATAAKKARLAAASPPNAWTRMRKEEPKANRTGTTPPTRAWSWPALYLRCQRASGKCANARPKKSSPPGTELLFWLVAKYQWC
jgi:hypothetical protein